MIKRILALAVLLALATISTLPTSIAAQEDREGIGISPTRITPSVAPGGEKSGEFLVINGGTEPIRYRVYVNDFRVVNEAYDKNFEPLQSPDSPVSWIKVSDEVRELAAGAQEKIPYTVSVPSDVVPRGYYAVIFAETVPAEADTTGVARVKRVGSLVYLTVEGGSVEKGKFLGLQAAFWQRSPNIQAGLRVENSGNVHFAVEGEVTVKNIFGKTVHQESIASTILPETIRKFSPELPTSGPLGIYKIDGELRFLGESVNVGSRWVVVGSPFWIGLLVLLLVLWITSLRWWIKRRVAHKKAK